MAARRKPGPTEVTLDQWLDASRELRAARARTRKRGEARAALPPGSTRARVTTANARWMRSAEEADRIERALRDQWEAAQVKP